MPTNSFLRIEGERESSRDIDLKILYAIYTYESSRVSGTHGGMRLFSDCIWKVDGEFKDHVYSKLNLEWNEIEGPFYNLVEYLSSDDQRQMMRFKKGEDWYHLTRLAETIRTSGSLHEFQNREITTEDGNQEHRKFNIIEGTEWYPILRYGTARNLGLSEIVGRLKQKLAGVETVCERAGSHTLEDALEDLSLVLEGIDDVPKYRNNGGLKFSEFQVDAVVTSLMQSWTEESGEGLVITADTGMGKTLGFAIPVLTDAVMSLRNPQKSMSQLILYPRTALAGDQYAEFKKMVRYINKALFNNERNLIGIAVDSDGMVRTRRKGESVNRYANYPLPQNFEPREWGVGQGNVFHASTSVYSGENPAQIVLASIESFRRRLRNKNVMYGLKSGLSRIVFDEVHLSSGTQGGHHHFLVSRLKQICIFNGVRRTPRVIGVSATIAEPRQHLQKIWGGNINKISHVGGRNTSDGSPVSLMHHVMFKSRNGTAMIGALVDLSSSITHQRRATGIPRETGQGQTKKLQKTIGFSDSHQIVGDWYSFMLDNEATSDQNQTRRLNTGTNNLRRPYAHWHDRPLRRHPGGEQICGSCKQSDYSSDSLDLTGRECGEFFQREIGDPAEPQIWDLPLLDANQTYTIKGLDTCQYLEQGKCWWFATKSEDISSRPGSQAYNSSSDVVRTKRFTSITKKGEANNEDDADGGGGANQIFLSPAKYGAYPNQHTDVAQNEEVLHDFVIATPTLEVGVDMDNVSEVITHKAIRNISSYRQKVGRAGREIGSDVLAVTLASNRATDFQHFRSMRRLVSDEIREPVPVASNNSTILRHHAYEAVFDYLSSQGKDIELVPPIKFGESGFEEIDHNIVDAIDELNSQYCYNHVKWALSHKASDAEIQQAIDYAKQHLSMLLKKFSIQLNGVDQNISVYQWLSHYRKAGKRLKGYDANDGKWGQMDANFEQNLDSIDDFETKVNSILSEGGSDKIAELYDLNAVDYFGKWIENYRDDLNFRHVNNLRRRREEIINIVGKGILKPNFQWDGGFGAAISQAISFISALEDGDPIDPLIEKFQRLVKKVDTWYLSSILESVPDFLESRPYVALPSYFTNPHEANVDIISSYSGYRVDTATASETLRYLQPGMHTRRLNYGNRMFIEHTKELDLFQRVFRYDLDDEPPIEFDIVGGIEQDEVANIPQILGVVMSGNPQKARIKSVQIRGFPGLPNAGRNFCRQGSEHGDDSVLIGNQDLENGSSQMLIPKSYGINWTLVARNDEWENQLQTYKVKGINEGQTTLNAVRHPLIKRLFDSVIYDEKMSISQLGLGVARSNGVIIQPIKNHQSIAYNHDFITQGIRFKISDILCSQAETYSNNDVPFSAKTLFMLGHIIKQQFPSTNGFVIDAYLDVLVENSWTLAYQNISAQNSFPKTEDDFFKLIFDSGLHLSPESVVRRARLASVANDGIMGDIETDINNLITQFGDYFNGELSGNISDKRLEWYLETCANTLGVMLCEAVTEFSGVQPGTISYTTTNNDGKWSIEVYDNEPEGNGSCDLASVYFHIPAEIRQASHYFGERNLPSDSLCNIIERKLIVCMEHGMHYSSIDSAEPPRNAPEWFKSEHKEFKERFSEIWNELEISSPRDGRLHFMRRSMIREPENRGHQLELELALHLCDDGCPSCNADTMMNQYPPHLEKYVTNRGLLDEIIGDISKFDGYAKMIEDSDQLESEHGDSIEHIPVLNLQPGDDNASPLNVRFVCHSGTGVGFALIRGQKPLEQLDILTRYKEVL